MHFGPSRATGYLSSNGHRRPPGSGCCPEPVPPSTPIPMLNQTLNNCYQIDRQLRAIDVNIIGTSNLVKLCMKYGIKLIYICTDYVFKGDKGQYKENDPVFPVNKYAWSKLGGECAVRMYDNSIIIRTTFGPNEFPFEKAFVDQWTSRESVSTTALMIAELLDKDFKGTIHVGGKRKSVFEYAKGLDPKKDIKELSVNEINFKVPADTSMNCELYNSLVNKK